jgi:hypothetical protein
MKEIGKLLNHHRLNILASSDDGLMATLVHPLYKPGAMCIVASNGMGYDHVSVSFAKRCPTWEEMCMVKDIFFDDVETVIQFHPKKSEYINNHPYCLHLWKKQGENYELPSSIMTGFRDLCRGGQ